MLVSSLEQAQRWQVSLGQVLVSSGVQQCRNIYSDFSQSAQLPFLTLDGAVDTPEITSARDFDYLLQNQLILLQEAPTPLYATANLDISQDPRTRRQSFSDGRYAALITPRDHRAFFLTRYAKFLTSRATSELARWMPEFSAHKRLTPAQGVVISLVSYLLLLFGVASWQSVFLGLNIVFSLWFFSLIMLRSGSLAYMPFYEKSEGFSAPPLRHDADLPVYTILVALYRETSVLVQLSTALRALDYPTAKLDIKFLLEENDPDTIAAAKALNLPDNFELIVVPHSLPKTKPKALNIGLQFARGDYLVIFDAEDIPDPQQLRKALGAFARGDDTLACVQARLNFYNADDNWLTRQFTIEYSMLFDMMLPWLKKLDIPLPLGGTSNHFRTDILRKIGGWDPYNVTEDADLGIRLRRFGYSCDIFNSTTKEEAVNDLWSWIKQRSRWFKGWMQTYLVHMRHPLRLYQQLGFKGFFGFQIVCGGIVMAALFHPVFLVWTGYLLLQDDTHIVLNSLVDSAILAVNVTIFFSGYFLSMLAGAYALEKRGRHTLIPAIFGMPVYWLLLSIGAYYGLWQLFTKPFYWEKTDHGRAEKEGSRQ